MEETLPDKEELEWKESIQYLLVLTSSGAVLYSQEMFQDTPISDGGSNELLVGGALVAISTIVKEIVNHQGYLTVIRQESYSILLEESNDVIVVVISLKELESIRIRMKEFLEEFLAFYGEILETFIGNVTAFKPTKRLVEKCFS